MKSRVSREIQARFCESLGVKSLGATRQPEEESLRLDLACSCIGQRLDSQLGLEGANAVTGNGELGALGVFEEQDYFAGKPGVHLLNPVHIY